MNSSPSAGGSYRTESVLRLHGPGGHTCPSRRDVSAIAEAFATLGNSPLANGAAATLTFVPGEGWTAAAEVVPGLSVYVPSAEEQDLDRARPDNASFVQIQVSPQQQISHNSPHLSDTTAGGVSTAQAALDQPDLMDRWLVLPLADCLNESQRQQIMDLVATKRREQGQSDIVDLDALFAHTYVDAMESIVQGGSCSEILNQIHAAVLQVCYR